MTIHKLIVQTARPGSRAYPHGATAEGYWMQDGDFVWLTSENGTKLGERRRIPEGVDANDLPLRVEQRTTGVPVVGRCLVLDRVLIRRIRRVRSGLHMSSRHAAGVRHDG